MEEIKKDVKPGWRSTEFWLSTLAVIVSILSSSGLISDGSYWDKALTVVSIGLISMGYSVSRGMAKR